MTDEIPPAGIDVTRPTIARVYDYWLGGKDNFQSDREMGWRMAEVNPALPVLVRHNREFICAAVARAAAAGIGQFLDLGSGLPAHPAVHEAAREVIPDARVCYVDIDPVAVLHGEVLLAQSDGLAAIRADLTHPETVLANPQAREVIDMSRPVAVIMAAVVHFLPPDSAATVVAGYMDRAVPGSWLILSSGHYQDEELADRVQQAATHARFWNHDAADLTSMLGDLELVAPGVCEARNWMAGTGGEPAERPVYTLAAVGIKSR